MSERVSKTILRGSGRSVAAAALIGLAAALSAPPASATDAAPKEQTQASRQQVDKLAALLHERFDGAGNISQRRSAFRQLMEPTPGPTRVQIRHVDANGVDADLIWPARLHHPVGTRAILYIHGGGLYSGSPQTHRAIAGSLAKAASADVLLIDYRLAPENTYPAQINDALNGYRWLLEAGYRSENIVFAGESVGGTLAIEAVLRQMQARKPLPAAVIAMSPLTDLTATGASIDTNAGNDPVIGRAELDTIRKAYLDGTAPTDPGVSPLYADMTGFPPLLLQVGSREALLDDTQRLAKKAGDAGVDVTAEVWPGMIHQWQLFPFWLDDARRSNQSAAEFAMKHFADRPQEQ